MPPKILHENNGINSYVYKNFQTTAWVKKEAPKSSASLQFKVQTFHFLHFVRVRGTEFRIRDQAFNILNLCGIKWMVLFCFIRSFSNKLCKFTFNTEEFSGVYPLFFICVGWKIVYAQFYGSYYLSCFHSHNTYDSFKFQIITS